MDKDYMNVWVYDIETFYSCFSLVAANPATRQLHVFEISNRKNDSNRLRAFITKLYKEKATMVGFNNVGFDYPVLVHFLENKGICQVELHEYATEIIQAQNTDEGKWKYRVPQNKQWVRQVDLFLINHFNNKARATSLKMIEFNMRSEQIEDLPFAPDQVLTDDEIQKLVDYNVHDVLETVKFYEKCIPALKFRDELTVQLGIDVTNFDDTKIGKQKFIQALEKENPNACYRKLADGKRVMNQTKRSSIDLGEVIFPYVKFDRPEFQAVHKWLASQVITETKGIFTDIEEHHLGELAKYAHLTTKSKKLKTKETKDRTLYRDVRKRIKSEDLTEDEIIALEDSIYGVPDQAEIDALLKIHPKGWVERSHLGTGKTSFNFKWRIAETLNVVVDGFTYDYGVGGIHGSTAGKSYKSGDGVSIVSADVKSYYPNLSIVNNVYPEHLGETFCKIYKDLYEQRASYGKGTSQNAVLKLALNGTYGASNDKFSPFYDPKFTMAITINGQLLLTKLAEMLITKCQTANVVMINTDGLEFTIADSEKPLANEVCSEWEKLTGLVLESEEYKQLFIANVNNYVGVFTDGSIKRKGAYEYEGLGWHQNQSALVIKRAAVLKATEGKPIERTIRECKDPYDFMLRTKVPRSSSLVLRDEYGNDTPQQNICRYYIANNGGRMVKIMPPLEGAEWKREIGIDAAWLVKTCNNMKSFDWDINYDYYISEAVKLYEALGLE